MWIETLTINHCRLLKSVSLNLSPNINMIIGENASGKTSLLESLSILSSGRSFRTSHISDVISHKEKFVLIAAKINNENIHSKIGIEKSQSKTKIRINQKDVYSQAELSLHLPITVIHPDSINLLTGSPTIRRSYIDWLAFYLFPDFYQKWKSYRHILKQRNLCLKDKKHFYALDKWTNELIDLQPDINKYRKKAVEVLKPILSSISDKLLETEKLELKFKSGFPNDLELNKNSLLEYYNSKKEYDLKIKRTSSGVHRADIAITINGTPAVQCASRGQLKLLAISLLLAQSKAINISRSVKGILLIDDLAAELDKENKNKLITFLSSLEQQLIITSTKEIKIKNIESKLFHVKHGEFS